MCPLHYMAELGRYIYCIIQANEPKSFGPLGISEGFPEVSTVNYQDLAAVVSPSLVFEYPVTRDYSMAHQRAIETVMKEHAVLPVRFSTIAQTGEQIMTQVLAPRYEEFKGKLAWIADKQEVGLKAHWLDMKAIFKEVSEQDAEKFKHLKETMAGKHPDATYYDLIEAGRIVQQRLEEKRQEEERQLLDRLGPLAVEHRMNRPYGESMVASLVFLLEKANEETFHQAVSSLQEERAGRLKLKYITGVPPFNFVTIVIHLSQAVNAATS